MLQLKLLDRQLWLLLASMSKTFIRILPSMVSSMWVKMEDLSLRRSFGLFCSSLVFCWWLLSSFQVFGTIEISEMMKSKHLTGIEKYIYTPTSTSLETRHYPIVNVDFPGVTICPNAKIMKSKFKAAMSSSNLPWLNLTTKLDNENSGSGSDFHYSLLEYMINILMFNTKPSSVSNTPFREVI